MTHFGSYQPDQPYDDATRTSFYIPMRDGVRLAVDLYLPSDLNDGDKLPALIVATRYWRRTAVRKWYEQITGQPQVAAFFVKHGYALLSVDVRGTGASFGTRQHEWDAEEIQDGYDLCDWIVAQPWSNGRVGGYGTSYTGTTAELLTVPNHPAVKAVVPRFNEFDIFTDIAYPGGAYLRGFVQAWASNNRSLDNNRVNVENEPFITKMLTRLAIKGVAPVDADANRHLLHAAVADHASNVQADHLAEHIRYRDERSQPDTATIDDISVYHYQQQIEANGAAIYGWGGWFDAGTADAVIRRWLNFSNPQVAVIGGWNHGATQHASPYNPHDEDTQAHIIEAFRFLDHHLKEDVQTNIADDLAERRLIYFTCGAEAWRTTTHFPPAGTQMQRLYFAPDHALSHAAPADAGGEDAYRIDFTATTGKHNRWYTQFGQQVHYAGRAEAGARLLTYTSEPLPTALEITGYPLVSLQVRSSAEDGLFIVYLEDVLPDGRVFYLTEGLLRAMHRKISDEQPPYKQLVPYHSFKKADAMPLVPGEVAELRFGLLPISVRVAAGHRLRVGIAGADEGLFPRIPAEGEPTIHMQRNSNAASYIELPVVPF